MSVEFKLPELGEGIESADVVDVLVNVGDSIEIDQGVFEAETDKASMEVPSTVAGVVTAVHIKSGETIAVGAVVLTVDESAAPAAPAAPAKQETPKPEAPKAEVPPVVAPPVAPPAASPAPAAPAAASPTPVSTPATSMADRRAVAAAPSVRQFAREIGVDLQQVVGTGAGGRISKDDVKAHSRGSQNGTAAPANGGVNAPVGPAPDETVKMSKLRQVAAKAMSTSWDAIPHVTLQHKADITDLEAQRQKLKSMVEARGGRLTITPIFVKLVVEALKANPNLNAQLDLENKQFIQKKTYNIGVAVDTPRGLVVPVIKHAEAKSITEIALELGELGVKAREGKLTIDDMSGATFTISNLGSLGTGFFTPIVNLPQAAILGMGRAVKEPLWNGEGFVPRLMAPLSLSFDHRVVDGADGARFMQMLVNVAENPLFMSMA